MKRTALVHGLGRFGGGAAAARFLHRRGHRVRIGDRGAAADLQPSIAALQDLKDIDWQLGREDEALLDGVDLLVVNPAVPDDHPLLLAAAARGIDRTQEASLFLENYPGRTIAVTGTNGKSSTATLLHAALTRAGIPALLGGNIGHSLLEDESAYRKDQVAVLEISSYQLERVDPSRHRVLGTVFTRIGRDHIDRHKTLAAYRQAKAVAACMADEFVVHACDDPVAEAFASEARVRIRFGSEPPAPRSMGISDGWLLARTGKEAGLRLCHQDAMRLLGDFQRENALAAAAAAILVGAAHNHVGLSLANAAPLPFRLQMVAVVDGVRVYDNSVSTERDSTHSALRNVPGPIHWICGGKSKDHDPSSIARDLPARVRSVHLFGAVRESVQKTLEKDPGRPTVTGHDQLEQALDAAIAAARPGDALVVSPGFASYDQYPNFRARALAFHNWLRQRRCSGTTSTQAGVW